MRNICAALYDPNIGLWGLVWRKRRRRRLSHPGTPGDRSGRSREIEGGGEQDLLPQRRKDMNKSREREMASQEKQGVFLLMPTDPTKLLMQK